MKERTNTRAAGGQRYFYFALMYLCGIFKKIQKEKTSETLSHTKSLSTKSAITSSSLYFL